MHAKSVALLTVCFMSILVQGALPPSTGNYFYAELKSDRITDYDKDVMYLNV